MSFNWNYFARIKNDKMSQNDFSCSKFFINCEMMIAIANSNVSISIKILLFELK